jgi:hypothetical protein
MAAATRAYEKQVDHAISTSSGTKSVTPSSLSRDPSCNREHP